MDEFKIKKLLKAKYVPLAYFKSKTTSTQLVCYIRFSNLDTFEYIINQEILLIGKEAARVIPADIKSHQFLQKIKSKPAVRITDLLKKITLREPLAALKNYKAKFVFIPTCRNGFHPSVAIVTVQSEKSKVKIIKGTIEISNHKVTINDTKDQCYQNSSSITHNTTNYPKTLEKLEQNHYQQQNFK